MAQWQKLEARVLAQIRKDNRVVEHEGGVTIEMSVSPYDVPNEVKGDFDKESKRFLIEFKYLQDEPWKRESHGEHVFLRVGKHSHRLYGIEVDVTALGTDSVELKVQARERVNSALEAISHRHTHSNELVNYKAVESVLQKTPSLFNRIGHAA